ncbi:hypothetical protein SEA_REDWATTLEHOG_64 [Gordonia phage RedWattleHog]|uniref:Uncharacterized protein n=1 Tax=Gordonia phage Stormageddon TaxID=2656541 RepID=A0A649VRV2_9CAUD|nr:hypothetical protein KHQ86_gp061 [Gordonia phage Stormageddon]QGJ94924.1 hypothetical protein SEA_STORMAGEDDON_61 [Gordonia phage Stormageddon]QLF83568.1 hypothetical protein SEA_REDWATTLEHOG_64 [Gordonia phage RedWattleHog]
MSELVTREQLRTALEGGASYAEIVKTVTADAAAVEPKKRSNLAKRKAAFVEAVAKSDRKVLARLRRGMKAYVSSMADVEMTEPRELTHDEAVALMTEAVTRTEIDEFLESRKDTIKSLVFASIEESLRAKGVEDPEAHGGSLYVPELGKVFKKEGAGFKPAQLDQKALRSLLGDDADKVFVQETIPAKTVTVLDEEALGKLIMDKPEVLETVRQALLPGELKSARFVIRDYTPGEEEQ